MANLDKADLVLASAERFHNSVDSISGKAEDDLDAPVDQPVD